MAQECERRRERFAPRSVPAPGALRITDVVTLVYCCLKWIYLCGGARARCRNKSLQRGQREPEHGACIPSSWGVPAFPGVFRVGSLRSHTLRCSAAGTVPSLSQSPAHRNRDKMVIMLQTSSGKGSEADEKPYLRVRPLLLITQSKAVNSADTAIMGNEPAPVLDLSLPSVGWGQRWGHESRAGWVVSAAIGAAWLEGATPLDRHLVLWDGFSAF